MATNSRKTGFPEFFADAKSAESVRRQFIEAPLAAARQPAFGSALELAQLLSILPDAFAASERRELKRLQNSAEKKDARVAALEASIDQADAMRTMAHHGAVRAQRAFMAFASGNNVFHGFVSDSDLNPLEGLTVRLSKGKVGNAKGLSAVTDAEGYFSMPLGEDKYTPREWEKEDFNITPERISELFAQREKESTINQQQSEEGGRVEILEKRKLLHEDPIPIELDDGSVYREYVVSDKESSTSNLRDFISSQGSKPASSRVDTKEDATEASSASSSDEPPLAAAPAVRRGAKKRAARGAKSTKSTKKK